MSKKRKEKTKKDTPKKDISIFHRKSSAGKGDTPRLGITLDDWEKKYEKIFRPIKSGSKNYEITN